MTATLTAYLRGRGDRCDDCLFHVPSMGHSVTCAANPSEWQVFVAALRQVAGPALAECLEGRIPKREIAAKYGVGVSTLRQWVSGSRVDLEPISVRDERLKPPAPCGTRAGYCRHKRSGDPRCDPCWAANLAYMQAWRAAHPSGRAA